ncbi:MarR family winged helix-turn-helix transcriptional regulator [Phytoactinopolyspora halotolerans]|uniref:Winged helix-turn-helix transcriptional regulator n=1 Tax=Phytoactinopolyspora halotolerans TaxID=1981512 RepID=A0A6L9SCF3_9ACTN|nr:MarR family winged helix-turn-helix transcriptional regulator [Phytoactinopolyspora halotolerans]NEE02364.1 winged helix-turn-helix transcriptional regulator [Phytoactinopolyspora halotolerans]
MSSDPPGYELPLRLFAAFRLLIDGLHDELARQGHPDVRPVHGFALQAVGPDGATAAEIGRRLGVSKQAAGKTIDSLERLGYVTREPDVQDSRRKVVRLTDRGRDCLARSAAIFDRLRDEWEAVLGRDRLRSFEDDLSRLTDARPLRVDVPGWLGHT